MKRVRFLYFAIAIVFSLTSCVGSQRKLASAQKKTVVLICLDGLGFEMLQEIDPEFAKKYGVQRLVPTFPSNSLPSQVSIVTGKQPSEHGIADNQFKIPEAISADGLKTFKSVKMSGETQHLLAKPIWAEATELGINTYTMNYMYSQVFWNKIQHNQIKGLPHAGLKEKLDKTVELISQGNGKENLLFVIWDYAVDGVAHRWNHERLSVKWIELKSIIEEYQKQIEVLNKNGVSVEVIFTADHGHDYIDKKVMIDKVFTKLGYDNVVYSYSSGIMHLYEPDTTNSQIDEDLARFLKENGMNVRWYKNDNGRSGAIAELLGHATYDVGGSKELIEKLPKPMGTHGWNPEINKAMDAVVWKFPAPAAKEKLPAHVIEVKDYILDLFE